MKQQAHYLQTLAALGLAASLSAPLALFAANALQDTAQAASGFDSTIEALNPDREQSQKIRAILDDEATQSARSRHTAYQRILAVLSEAQRDRYQALIQQRFDRRLQQIADALNLTQDQKAELAAIMTLADDRFSPSIAGSDLTDAIRATLSDEQAQKLASLSPDYRIVADLWR